MTNQIPEQTVIALDSTGSKVYREVVAVVNLDGTPISGSLSANNIVVSNTFYKVLKAWGNFAVNGTSTYRSTTNPLAGTTATGWYDGSDVLQADPPDTSYYTTLTDSSTFAHTHLVDANGVMFYYVSRPSVSSVAYKVADGSIYTPVGSIGLPPNFTDSVTASDGVSLPLSSLSILYGGVAPGTEGSWTQTVVYKGITYIKTIVFDASGNLSSQGGWVKQ